MTTLFEEEIREVRLELEVDYTADPIPPLSDELNSWADRLLHDQGLRS